MRSKLSRVIYLCGFTLLFPLISAVAQTPVALPTTMTTLAGGSATTTSYTAGSTTCPGLSSRVAATAFGDNCAAISASFGASGRGGVAVDSFGNVFVADDIGFAVHKIDQSTGLMTLVAGLGTTCTNKVDYYGDGCPAATGTILKGIRGIGIDPYGNVLVADYNADAVHIVCRTASPLCTSAQVGTMQLVAGCFNGTSSSSYAGKGAENTPAMSVSGACSTSKGETNQPRGVAADMYGNVYYADTASLRYRVVVGPKTSSYFSGTNPVYAALAATYSSVTQGYVYTVAGSVTTAVTSCTTGTLLDSLGDGCASGSTMVINSAGSVTGVAVDAAGNMVFADGTNGLRVFFVSNSGTAGSQMAAAISKNNTSVTTPTPGYVYRLAGGSTGTISSTPALGSSVVFPDANANKLTVSPVGNIYIGDNAQVFLYDISAGTIQIVLKTGTAPSLGAQCGSTGAYAKGNYGEGCPASATGSYAPFGNSGGLGVAVDGQENLYMYDSSSYSGGMLVRKVLAQGMGVQPQATQAALASMSTAYPLEMLGTTQTQVFRAHFPPNASGTLGSATADVTKNSSYSIGSTTASCTYTSNSVPMDCSVTVNETPSATGAQPGAMTVTASNGSTLTMSLGGTATGSVLAIDGATSGSTSLLSSSVLLPEKTPTSIAVDGAGNLYETTGTSIVERTADRTSTLTLASGISGTPTQLALDPTGDVFYLNGSTSIQELALTTAASTPSYTSQTLSYTPANLGTANPVALATDALGNVYVADTQNSATTIYRISPAAYASYGASSCSLPASSSLLPTLCQSTVSGAGAFGVVTALTVDAGGNVYVADSTNNAIYKLAPGLNSYTQTTVLSGTLATALASDAAGDLYVQSGTQVTMYPLSGNGSVPVLGGITTPAGIAVDGSGNLYSADAALEGVIQLTRGTLVEDFGSDYSLIFSATLTNVGNQTAAAQSAANGVNASSFTLAGGASNGCSFTNDLLGAMTSGASCTMTAQFPAFGNTENYDYIALTPTASSTTALGTLTLKGLANREAYATTTTIGDPSSTCTVTTSGSAASCTYAASGTEASFPITVTASSGSTDGSTSITSGPTTSNYVNVRIDSGATTSYNFTTTSGLTASLALDLSGMAAGTHTVTVSFPQQGSFLTSSATYSGLTIEAVTPTVSWSPAATTQQVSAPIGTGILNATISPSIEGNFAYAYGAAPSCTATSAATGSTPIDASTYLPIGSYTLYATFCPTDTTDYNSVSITTGISYTVSKATTTAEVGASQMVVAPSGGNYTSLTTALQALPATGGTIYLAPGIYAGQNVISYPNVQLRGLGGDATQVILTGENGAFSTSTFTTATLPTGFSFGPAGKGGDEGSATLDISKNTYQGQKALSGTFTPNNFYAEYLTIQNTYNTDPYTTSTEYASSNGGTCSSGGTATSLQNLYNNNMECGSQALAMWITSDQAILNHVNLISQQDTLYAGTQGCGTYCTSTRQYMWQGLITGNVDYVFGDAALVFDHTNFFTTWHGLTATGNETIEAQNKRYATGTTSTTNSSYATSSDYLSGFVCNSCTLMSQSTGMSKLYYGRPYNISSSSYPSSYSTFVLLNSQVDQVNASGWIGWDGASQYLSTSTYGEFNTQAYWDPTPGTPPYPYALFNSATSTSGMVPSLLYIFDDNLMTSSYTYYYGSATTGFNLAGGNTGSGATSLSSRESAALHLTAGTAVPWYPINFLATTVPSTKLSSGSSSSWNPVAALAQQVNNFVPTASIGSITNGSSVTILGRPQTPGAGVIPTGSYVFYDSLGNNQSCTAASANCTVLQSGALDASGAAYLTTSSLAAGTHTITMTYAGDSNFSGSTSSPYSFTVLAVGQSATTTALTVDNLSSTTGTAITGSVAVTPATATGAVSLYLDGTVAASCTLASGSCTWSLANVAAGTHTLYASYAGDNLDGNSSSSTATLTVIAPIATGDTRTVSEPSIPATCQTLTAALTTNTSTQDLDTSVDANNSNIDGARIQAALTACAGTGKAVELATDSTGSYNAFLSGPLTMPSNVTLLVDPNVTLYFSRNVQDYDKVAGTHTCGTINAGSNTANCLPLIEVPKGVTNVGIMGYGKLNGRGGDALLNTFTTSGYAMPSAPTWWSISAQANGEGNQQNPRFIQLDSGSSNVTLYKITLMNSPHFHVSTTGSVSGLTAWGVKIVTPTSARNTDGIDPGSVTDGTITQSWISGGDDNIAVGASSNPSSNLSITYNHFFAGHGESIGSYTGGGVSNVLFDHNIGVGNAWAGYGSAALTGVADTNSTAIRLKSANDRGGLVTNIQYSNSCFVDHKADLQFTPYYSSGDGTSTFPSYTNILLQNILFKNDASSYGSVELTGEYNTNNGSAVTNPLGITFDNVTFPLALSSLVNSTTPAESASTSTAWGTNTSGGTGQYVNLTVGAGQVSSNFLTAYNNLAAVSANNDTLTNQIVQSTLNPPDCTITYLIPELTGGNGTAQSVVYGNAATLDVILTPAVAATAYPTGTVTVTDTNTAQSFTATLSGTGDTLAVTIPSSDLTVGTHTFTANYAGDSNYTIPANYQNFGSYTVTVTAAPQTISFTPAVTSYPYTLGGSFPLSATASSGLAVSFASKTVEVCTVAGATATILSGGTCTIEATQAGNSNYQSATPVDVDFTIAGAAQTINFVPATTSYPYTAGGSFALSASASSGLTVSFASKTTAICTVNGTTATIIAAGTCTIEATQAGNANYSAATPVDASIAITQATPVVTVTTSSSSITQGNALTFTLNVSSGAGTPTGTVKFLDGTTVLGSGTVSNGKASLTSSSLSAGTHVLTAVYLGDTNFASVTSGTISVAVVGVEVSVPTSGSTVQTIEAGGTAAFTLSILPSSGTSFPSTMTLSLSGVPTGATATIAPTNWAQTSSTTWALPAGATLYGNTIISIAMPTRQALLTRPGADGALALAFGLLLPFALRIRRYGRKLGGMIVSLLLLAAIIAGMSACASDNKTTMSYPIVATVSSGSNTQSTTFTLIVK